jgi:hypothetical protein
VDFRETIRKTIRRGGVAADVNAVIAAKVGEPGLTHTHVSSKQRIVQRGGRTEVYEERREVRDEA